MLNGTFSDFNQNGIWNEEILKNLGGQGVRNVLLDPGFPLICICSSNEKKNSFPGRWGTSEVLTLKCSFLSLMCHQTSLF